MMPENLHLALVIVGAILLLIGLVGGQFKLFGAEVSGQVGRASRWTSGITGVFLIIVGIYLGGGTANLPLPAPAPTQSTQPPVEAPASTAPARQDAVPETAKTPPPARVSDPDTLLIDTAQWPHTDDGRLRDSRVREAVSLALKGENIPRARKLMAEAGWSDGLTITLPLHAFIAAGGTQDDIQQIKRRLVSIGVRVEVRD